MISASVGTDVTLPASSAQSGPTSYHAVLARAYQAYTSMRAIVTDQQLTVALS